MNLALPVLLVALSSPQMPTKSELAHQYAIQAKAFAKRDAVAYLATYTTDYQEEHRERHADLTIPRKLLDQHLRQSFHDVLEQKKSTRILSLKPTKGGAVAHVKQHSIGQVRNPVNGAVMELTIDSVSDDIWVHNKDGWKISRSTISELDTKTKLLKKGEEDPNEGKYVEPSENGKPTPVHTTGGGIL